MQKKLTTFSLVLLTVGSVDSIRNLPAAALVGKEIFFYFTLALFLFLLPSAIVAAWFAGQSNEGVYGWVKQSLGRNVGFIAIWFQWMQNILVYPTFFSFIAGSLLYCLDPHLVENKGLLFALVNLLIWSLTWINLKGIYLSSKINTLCSLMGILLPFLMILTIGLIWLLAHPYSLSSMQSNNQSSWASLTAIILSFCGIEIAAVHLQDSKLQSFTKAIAISVLIIFITMLFGALTLAMLIPIQQLNFISGIPEIIQLFFAQIQLKKIVLPINLLIVIGCIGCANNWLLAPVKGLLFATYDYNLNTGPSTSPSPRKLLLIQATGVSLISSLFLFLPAINDSYWLMLTLATQMYLLMYLLMFIGAIKQAWLTKRKYYRLILLMSLLGLLGISLTLIVTFIPPPSLKFNSKLQYDLFVAGLLLFLALTSLLAKKHFIRPPMIFHG